MKSLSHVVTQVLSKGVLTQEDVYSINHLLRQAEVKDMDALDRLLDALMRHEVRSQAACSVH
ncbi:MAG: hypothetical protein Q6J68_04020 [Thermostichales cyanobacterium SZTDM-1c_bins_54]